MVLFQFTIAEIQCQVIVHIHHILSDSIWFFMHLYSVESYLPLILAEPGNTKNRIPPRYEIAPASIAAYNKLASQVLREEGEWHFARVS